MKLQDYISSRPYIKVSSAIDDRWRNRIELYGWHNQGEDGAAKYLVRYGKSIGVPKVLALAKCASNRGRPDVANGFYMYAARMEGVAIDKRMSSEFAQLQHRMNKMPPVKVLDTYDEFPALCQPGKVKIGIASPAHPYVGTDLIAFITEKETLYQIDTGGNQLTLQQSLEFRVDERLRELARVFGAYVVHANLGWVDFAGDEHATADESIQANTDIGFDTLLAEPILTIVACLHCATSYNALQDFDNILAGDFVRVRSLV